MTDLDVSFENVAVILKADVKDVVKILLTIDIDFEWYSATCQAELGRLLAEARSDVVEANPEAADADVLIYLQVRREETRRTRWQ